MQLLLVFNPEIFRPVFLREAVSNQAKFFGARDSLGSTADAEAAVGVLEVIVDCTMGYSQDYTNFQ